MRWPDDALALIDGAVEWRRASISMGLSYAQIARELYVTGSTVAFHLSNAYAKTGITSRHELVQLVRAA